MPSGQDIILVVDDDQAVRDSLKFALEIEGLVVHVCADGRELIGHPELWRARCLILDYKMPVMDGLAVISQLAAIGLRLPVILITAHATDSLRRRAAAAGVRHTLEKPLQDSALLDSIHDVLGVGPAVSG
ncbi:response regulator transcription factor [Acidisoma cladoniae]|jgi:two-component system response regulator FixJ|uniref:response regulator transcription factor n=1 Tax=Acidisoma cladoniae TaxID=3040935 RepID=UPI00254A8D4C|nr:response regulator [Acidisoma sp. PAMC 29798]